MRLKLFETEKIEFQIADFITVSRSLLNLLTKATTNRLEYFLENTKNFNSEEPEYFRLMLEVYERRENDLKAFELIQTTKIDKQGYPFTEVLEIRKKELDLAISLKQTEASIIDIKFKIAAFSTSFVEAYNSYLPLKASLDKTRIENELIFQEKSPNTECAIALLVVWSENNDFDPDFGNKLIAPDDLKYSKSILWHKVLPLFSPDNIGSIKDVILELIQDHKNYDESFIDDVISNYLIANQEPESAAKSLLRVIDSTWVDYAPVMGNLLNLIVNIELSDPIHMQYLDLVSETSYFKEYVIWYLGQPSRDDECLYIIIKRLYNFSTTEDELKLLNKVTTEILTLPKSEFPNTSKYIDILFLLMEVDKLVVDIEAREGNRDNPEYYHKINRYFTQSYEEQGESGLQMNEKAFVLYLFLRKKLGNSRFLTLRRMQAEAMVKCGLIDELKELDKTWPGIEMGSTRTPLQVFIQENEEQLKQNLESKQVILDTFESVYPSIFR